MSNRNNKTKSTSDHTDATAIATQQARPHKPFCWKDTCAMVLIAASVRRVKRPHVFNFLGSVLFEQEIQEVFAYSPGVIAGMRHYRGECIDKAAQRMRFGLVALGAPGPDAAYCAALLVCIQMQFESTYGIVKATDILRSITCGALHKLDDADSTAASQMRALLGWGNEDEMDRNVVQGFKTRVLALYEQETTIQLMRMQPVMQYQGVEPHSSRKYVH